MAHAQPVVLVDIILIQTYVLNVIKIVKPAIYLVLIAQVVTLTIN
jgi:hypothetical protein